jgi:hypothetical protein
MTHHAQQRFERVGCRTASSPSLWIGVGVDINEAAHNWVTGTQRLAYF